MMARMIINNNAAKLVRNATTPSGENLSAPMAALPNTGASPKNNAENSAELMPVIRPLCMRFSPVLNAFHPAPQSGKAF